MTWQEINVKMDNCELDRDDEEENWSGIWQGDNDPPSNTVPSPRPPSPDLQACTTQAAEKQAATGGATIVSRMALNDNKAGMQGLDRVKINKIIYEASKGKRGTFPLLNID